MLYVSFPFAVYIIKVPLYAFVAWCLLAPTIIFLAVQAHRAWGSLPGCLLFVDQVACWLAGKADIDISPIRTL